MSDSDDFNSTDDSFITSEIPLPRTVRFWLLLLFNIPSTVCSLCIIIYIIFNRTQRRALHNHSILLILIFGLPIQLIDIHFYLVFFHYGSVQPSTPVVCLLWWLTDYGFYIGGFMLMTWLAIERHILIFHDQCVSNRRGRFLFHYLPLIVLVTYICLFYLTVIFLLPCENTYVYTVPVCGATPCYQSYQIISMWEFIVNTSTPILLESIVSAALILRVQWQKRRLHRSPQWRKHRRLIIQLCLISGMNVTLNLPNCLIPLAHLCGLPEEYGLQAQLYFFFLGYFVIFLFPFASLCQFPTLRKKIKHRLFGRLQRRPRQTPKIVPIMGATLVNRVA